MVAVFEKEDGELAYLNTELGHAGTIYQDTAFLKPQPIVETDTKGTIADRQVHQIGPVKGIALGTAGCNADHIIGPSFVGTVSFFCDGPDTPVRATAGVKEVFLQYESGLRPSALDVDGEMGTQIAESILKYTPRPGLADEEVFDGQFRRGTLKRVQVHRAARCEEKG